MADHTGLMGAPMVDVGPALDRALDAWATKVQARARSALPPGAAC